MFNLAEPLDRDFVLCQLKNYIRNESHCAFVFVGVAIVGGWENGQCEFFVIGALLVAEPLDLHLMATDDHLYFIVLEEAFSLYSTVVIGTASHGIGLPLNQVVIGRIAPHQVTHDSFVLNLYETVDFLKLLYVHTTNYSSMLFTGWFLHELRNMSDRLLHTSGVCRTAPWTCHKSRSRTSFRLTYTKCTLYPEIETACHYSAFVIASQQKNILLVLQFKYQEKRYDFDTKQPTIHIIP